jgi:hypothetical protein
MSNSYITLRVKVGENHCPIVFSLATSSQEGCEALFVEGMEVTGERGLLHFINYLTHVLLSQDHSISILDGREEDEVL